MTTDLLNNLRNSSPNEGSHDLCCRCLDAAKEIAALRAQAEAGYALLSLTPGGSEYFIEYKLDVKACLAYVRARYNELHHLHRKIFSLRNAVIEECARHIEDRDEAFGNTFADEIRELLTKDKK